MGSVPGSQAPSSVCLGLMSPYFSLSDGANEPISARWGGLSALWLQLRRISSFTKKTAVFPRRLMLVLSAESTVLLPFLHSFFLSEGLSLPASLLSVLDTGFSMFSFSIGPSPYPNMAQECFPNEMSSSNWSKDIAVWRPCLSKRKRTQNYAPCKEIKISTMIFLGGYFFGV